MKKKINYVVCDLDGTLLNDKKEIDGYTLRVLNSINDNGIKIIFATGRHYNEVLPYIDILGRESVYYTICCDGQYIYDSHGNIIWESKHLLKEDICFWINHSNYKKMIVVTDKTDYLIMRDYFLYVLVRAVCVFHKKRRTIRPVYYKLINIVCAEKIRFVPHDCNIDYFLDNSKYTLHRIFNKYIDITAYGVNKYSALKYLSDIKQINLDEVIYFGDDDNDKECFKNIDYSVAMKNSVDTIMQLANYCTEDNNSSGVGIYLDKLLCG